MLSDEGKRVVRVSIQGLKRQGMGVAALVLVSALFLARPGPVAADPGAAPWGTPQAIVTGLKQANRPALAYTSDDTSHLLIAHAVWESDGVLLYATQAPGHLWSKGTKIANGIAPSLVADAKGDLHLVYADRFGDNYEIYYVYLHAGRWSLPTNISHTTGSSGQPVVALGSDGSLHAAWMDNTPGYWTIYHAWENGIFWSSQPIPSARGAAPAIAAGLDGSIYVAWQNKATGANDTNGPPDVFVARRAADKTWGLPLDISDRPGVESIGAHMAATSDGMIQLIWVDGSTNIRYAYGIGTQWSAPQTLSAAATARGPRIVVEQGTLLHVVWDEGGLVRGVSAQAMSAKWPKAIVITDPTANLRDVTLALRPEGGLAVGWVQIARPGDVSIYESVQEPAMRPRVWLPVQVHR